MASFSNQAKTEICGSIRKAADRRAFLTGVLLACRRMSRQELVLQTECEALAELFPALLQSTGAAVRYDTEYRGRSGKQPVWSLLFDADGVAALTGAVHLDCADRCASLSGQKPDAVRLLAAGCFVIGGSITDPERGYHMEIVIPDAEFGHALQELLHTLQPAFAFKQTARKGDCVLYLKQNEQICDALTYFGAQNASLALVEQQVFRSIRSQTNRRTNCDLANIDKTIAAGEQQVADILLIQRTIGLDALPETLQEIAAKRLADPEANLRDLGAQCSPPISRSGVHHRLQRISGIADRHRNRLQEK